MNDMGFYSVVGFLIGFSLGSVIGLLTSSNKQHYSGETCDLCQLIRDNEVDFETLFDD